MQAAEETVIIFENVCKMNYYNHKYTYLYAHLFGCTSVQLFRKLYLLLENDTANKCGRKLWLFILSMYKFTRLMSYKKQFVLLFANQTSKY